MGSQPFQTSRHFDFWRGHYLESYAAVDALVALKMGMDFIIDVFGCTVGKVSVDGDRLSELFGLGITSVTELHINFAKTVNIKNLKFLLETIRVADEYVFCAPIPANFSCDPRIFNCRRLSFMCDRSADWVTLELLCQFDVPQLNVMHHRLSKQDAVSYITSWFNSENRKLEYVRFAFRYPISLEDFEIDHLNPIPFCEKRRSRYPLHEPWRKVDISSGMDIFRQDGILATFFVKHAYILFYVWHKRFPDAVEHN